MNILVNRFDEHEEHLQSTEGDAKGIFGASH